MSRNLDGPYPMVSIRLGKLEPLVREALKRKEYSNISALVKDALRWRLKEAPIDGRQVRRLERLAEIMEVTPTVALRLLLDRYARELAPRSRR